MSLKILINKVKALKSSGTDKKVVNDDNTKSQGDALDPKLTNEMSTKFTKSFMKGKK